MKLRWDKSDVEFLDKKMDFCFEFYMKTKDERFKEWFQAFKEIKDHVKGKDITRTKGRKVVVKWC